MRFLLVLALLVALTGHAAEEDLLLYLDFEQTPPQDPYYLASDAAARAAFEPVFLDALEQALGGGDDDPVQRGGVSFDPLLLNAIERSLGGASLDPRILSVSTPTDSYTGLASDQSGAARPMLASGDVVLLAESRSKVAYFASHGRLLFPDAEWWGASPPRRAMSVLAWVRVHQLIVSADMESTEAPVSLFPYVTANDGLAWSLHAENGEPIFVLRAPLSVGEWMHLAGTYDAVAGQAKLYLNGEEVAIAPGAAELGVYAGPTGSVKLDSPHVLSTWDMDDFNVWGRALSGDEVRSVMQFGPALDSATAVDEGDTVTTWAALKGE